MKQKVVVKVQMNCGRCRSKAMKIAAGAEGVISVAIEGAEKDQVVVIGEGVDSACLTHCLRKKVGYATLVSVEEVKPKSDGKPNPDPAPVPVPWTTCHNPQLIIASMDCPSQPNCSIM